LLLRRRKAVAATAVSTTGGTAAPGAGGAVAGRDGDVLATIPDSLAPLIDGGMLTPAGAMQLVDYSAKLGTTRSLVNDDADRATAVARQMLAAT